MYRVIISHNQTESLCKFPGTILTVVVLDAPTDKDITTCHTLGYASVIVPVSGNRGVNRNAGLNNILESYSLEDSDVVEFLDGDRYPTGVYSSESVQHLMDRDNLDCLLYTCYDDARLHKLRGALTGTALVDTGTLCNPFYSCGFAMRVSAIRQVMAFNHGSFFEPRFTRWGCEDQYMGLVCCHLGHRVAMTSEVVLNGSVGGDSHAHADYKESLQTYVDLIRERNLPIRNEPVSSQ